MSAAKISRREALVGLAALGAVALQTQVHAQPSQKPDIRVVRVPWPLTADPEATFWTRVQALEVALTGQAMVLPTKMRPSVSTVRVRAAHDGERVGFLLEWSDPRPDRRVVKTREFKDGCAVMLLPSGAGATEWMMGTPTMPATVLHWRADWQQDLDAGFQDLETAFPNVAVDFYPPLVGATQRPKLPGAYPEGARMWLPGWRVGNPLSQPQKKGAVEKLVAQGAGTLEQLPTQNATGRGIWKDGRWRVALSKPLRAVDAKEINLQPGQTYAVAFAVWQGAHHDRGARKSITLLGRLRLEP